MESRMETFWCQLMQVPGKIAVKMERREERRGEERRGEES